MIACSRSCSRTAAPRTVLRQLAPDRSVIASIVMLSMVVAHRLHRADLAGADVVRRHRRVHHGADDGRTARRRLSNLVPGQRTRASRGRSPALLGVVAAVVVGCDRRAPGSAHPRCAARRRHDRRRRSRCRPCTSRTRRSRSSAPAIPAFVKPPSIFGVDLGATRRQGTERDDRRSRSSCSSCCALCAIAVANLRRNRRRPSVPRRSRQRASSGGGRHQRRRGPSCSRSASAPRSPASAA